MPHNAPSAEVVMLIEESENNPCKTHFTDKSVKLVESDGERRRTDSKFDMNFRSQNQMKSFKIGTNDKSNFGSPSTR